MEAVIVSTTMASVMELDGREITPVAFRLVVVILVATKLVGLKLVAARLVKKALVEVIDVPVADVNPSSPDNVPPVSNR